MNQRITLAKERFLADPSARIGEVAALCGYEDSNYFSRVFRSQTGVTPRDYGVKISMSGATC